jgi:hypothetical protein
MAAATRPWSERSDERESGRGLYFKHFRRPKNVRRFFLL